METKEINDKISVLKRRRKEFSREAQKFKEEIDREIRNLKELLNDDIKVGDFVETNERYEKEIMYQSFSGVVIKIRLRYGGKCGNNHIHVKKLNGEIETIDETWLQKKKVNPICRVIFAIVTDKKKVENEIKLFDAVKGNYEKGGWTGDFTGIVIKIDNNNLVTVKCMNGMERNADMSCLEKCE